MVVDTCCLEGLEPQPIPSTGIANGAASQMKILSSGPKAKVFFPSSSQQVTQTVMITKQKRKDHTKAFKHVAIIVTLIMNIWIRKKLELRTKTLLLMSRRNNHEAVGIELVSSKIKGYKRKPNSNYLRDQR